MRALLAALGAVAIAALLPPALSSTGAGVPVATAQARCASLGTATDFDVFVRGDYTVENNQLQGRAAAGGNVRLRSFGISTALPRDPQRLDLIAGGSLDVANAQANGSVRYGGSLTGAITVPPGGTLAQGAPPFSFGASMDALELLSAEWAALPQTGTVTLQPWGALQLSGTGAGPHVYNLTTAQLLAARTTEFLVPDGTTVLVNVTGSSYSTAAAGAYGAGRAGVNAIWNFPLATSVQISGMNWYGTVLAPDATVSAGNGQIYGQVLANALTGSGTILRAPFGGCLPPPPPQDLALAALCVNPVTDRLELRLRNTGGADRTVTWTDDHSAQTGTFVARAGEDRFFEVEEGAAPHRIVARAGSLSAAAEGVRRSCRGRIVVRKRVTGTGSAPAGPWRITVTGDSGFSGSAELDDGESATFDVPGEFEVGSAPIGDVVGGYRYTVTEPDPLGGVASVDQVPVTILDGEEEVVTIGNEYAAPVATPEPTPTPTVTPEPTPTATPAPTPEPTPGPGEVVPTPPQPTLPPGAPSPPSAPDLSAVLGIGRDNGADLEISERFSRARVAIGRRFTSIVRVRNRGVAPAVGVVAREIPQRDPRHPNRVVRIVSVDGAPRCTTVRPIRCELGTLAPGDTVVARVAVRGLVTGALKSVVTVSATTPELNTTNNLATEGIVVRRPRPVVDVAVAAPPLGHVGDALRYRVRMRAGGRAGARFVRLCHRPPPGLLVTAAPGTVRRSGRLCRDVDRLRRGAGAGFTVTVTPAARTAGRTLRLRARATAPGLRSARGADRVAVAGRSYVGTG